MTIRRVFVATATACGLLIGGAAPALAASFPAPSPGYQVTARDTATVIAMAKRKFPEIKATPSRCMTLKAPQVQGSPYVLTLSTNTSALIDSECGAWNEFAFHGGVEAKKATVKGKRVWKVIGREDVVEQGGDGPVALEPQ